MKILIFTAEIGYDKGGMALSCSRLVDFLSKEHTVLIDNSNEYPIDILNDITLSNMEIVLAKEYKLKEDCILYNDVDIIVAFGANYNGYFASLVSDRLHKPFILLLRGSDVNIAKWNSEKSWYLKEACNRANKIVCLSNEMINNIVSINPSFRKKTLIIPNAFSSDYSSIIFPNLPSEVKIGCAASELNEKKGIINLLNMVSEFKIISDVPISFEAVGKVDDYLLRIYHDLIKNNELQNNVKLIGYVPRERLINIVSNWDFYIQGSICEGQSNAISECLQNGKAFISTNTGFYAEVLKKDFPELFFDSWSPPSMAKHLKYLINLKDKEYLYKSAFNKLNELCAEKIVVSKWHELFNNSILPSNNLSTVTNIEYVTALIFHDIQPSLRDSITIPEAAFKEFVEFVYKRGYELCSMKSYIENKHEDRKKKILCTFDDGYENLLYIALPILKKYNFTATAFVCTGLLGNDNAWNNKDTTIRRHLTIEELQELYSNGWEIASHGVTHRNLLKLSLSDVEYELSESKLVLTKQFGEIISYSYPYGDYCKMIFNIVRKYYQYAFSVMNGGNSIIADNLRIRRYSINEIYKMLAID